MQQARIGIDLGGTKIEIIVLDKQGKQCLRQRTPTPQGDYQATLQTIHDLVISAESQLSMRCNVGVAMPGTFSSQTGRVKNANSVCLNGKPLQQDLEALLGRPCRFSNDANCFALSEAIDGGVQTAHCIFGVILGTGTGAGIVIDKQILTGRNGIGGEWGHNPLPWPADNERPGPACYCGHHGCIETFLSGPALCRDHAAVTGCQLTVEQIVTQAVTDPQCEATMQRYEDRLARGLAHVINILDPDVIVLGGGLSNIERLYRNVPQRWLEYVFSDVVETRLSFLTWLRPVCWRHGTVIRVAYAAPPGCGKRVRLTT
jgi:fructokinase